MLTLQSSVRRRPAPLIPSGVPESPRIGGSAGGEPAPILPPEPAPAEPPAPVSATPAEAPSPAPVASAGVADEEPDSLAEARLRLGMELEAAGRPMEAAQAYADAARADRGRSLPLARLALVYALQDRELQNAERVARHAIELAESPAERAVSHEAMAEVLLRRGEPDAFLEHQRQALANYEDAGLSPPVDTLFRWGLALASLRDAPEAERLLRRALEADPQRDESHVALADLLSERGRFHEARAHYERARLLLDHREDLPLDVVEIRAAYLRGRLGMASYALYRTGVLPPASSAPTRASRWLNRLRDFVENPGVKLFAGLLLITAGLAETYETFYADLASFQPRAHHALVIFGFLNVLGTFPDLLEGLEYGLKYFREGRPRVEPQA
ncbi:tetratricopeptide repeat protein [Tautonia sociabilis]|uniref:Tetratricopeptide repeat protein n=1 Tax=Tautonia sociabilis TaxID=2080755 RepID=A0A432MM84_9BACT|nr:tetratricopeptide repeat protein [Tautonia sociabilis]RUL88531.1 tetratricopeptide repeat protein [Tautonia sociabilis]